jgi:hypothetical protein
MPSEAEIEAAEKALCEIWEMSQRNFRREAEAALTAAEKVRKSSASCTDSKDARTQEVHTCHAKCPCQTGGEPMSDFVEARTEPETGQRMVPTDGTYENAKPSETGQPIIQSPFEQVVDIPREVAEAAGSPSRIPRGGSMIIVELTAKEASALRRSAPVPITGATRSHRDAHWRAVQKIRAAEYGVGQSVWVKREEA